MGGSFWDPFIDRMMTDGWQSRREMADFSMAFFDGFEGIFVAQIDGGSTFDLKIKLALSQNR